MKSVTPFGTDWKEWLNFMKGVELQDAFWMHCFKCSAASKTLFCVLRQTFTFSWNTLQSVFELCKWHGVRTYLPIQVIRWKFKTRFACGMWQGENPFFATTKSIRSVVLLVSAGQEVGSPVEITLRFRFSIAHSNCLPFGEINIIITSS